MARLRLRALRLVRARHLQLVFQPLNRQAWRLAWALLPQFPHRPQLLLGQAQVSARLRQLEQARQRLQLQRLAPVRHQERADQQRRRPEARQASQPSMVSVTRLLMAMAQATQRARRRLRLSGRALSHRSLPPLARAWPWRRGQAPLPQQARRLDQRYARESEMR